MSFLKISLSWNIKKFTWNSEQFSKKLCTKIIFHPFFKTYDEEEKYDNNINLSKDN